ncbi:MAG: DUF975 family protein [Bacteroidales bacterium]|nr:DUF975 family protein [Bacteroidales bacterium]
MEEPFRKDDLGQDNAAPFPHIPCNSTLRATARKRLDGNWFYAALTTLVYYLVGCATGCIPFAGLLVTLPLSFGFNLTFLKLRRGELDNEEMPVVMFDVFHKYGRYLGTGLLRAVYILLWTMLLIVPGIIMSYAYAMTPYIAHDNPELSADECIDYSQQMMKGHKWQLFCLDLSFIGWAFLCIFTMGIGLLWLVPYIQSSHAEFYENLKSLNE